MVLRTYRVPPENTEEFIDAMARGLHSPPHRRGPADPTRVNWRT
ncbi:hypothetical protein ACIRRA_10120 [Nocardia sp. NPDC101769]